MPQTKRSGPHPGNRPDTINHQQGNADTPSLPTDWVHVPAVAT